MPEGTATFTIDNQYSEPVVVYSTSSLPLSSPPSVDVDAYNPVYTRLGMVEMTRSGSFSATSSPARIVVARATDDFPIALAIVDSTAAGSQAVTVNAASYATAEKAWKFYQLYASEPYQPIAITFSGVVLNNANPAQLDQQVTSFFTANGYAGVDLGIFAMVCYWATNSLYAFPGTYWCYEPAPATTTFVLPTESVGQIGIGAGTATYRAAAAPPPRRAPPDPGRPPTPAAPRPRPRRHRRARCRRARMGRPRAARERRPKCRRARRRSHCGSRSRAPRWPPRAPPRPVASH